MIEFKSKTNLIEHIKELVKNGYLIEKWFFDSNQGKTNTKATKFYKINFKAVTRKKIH